jgi:amidohydrolase
LELDKLKAAISGELDARQKELSELSRRIHDNPEPGSHEVRAAYWLSKFLKDNGFTVASGIGELPTAFRASFGSGEPVIALLAEYDALPGLGHACGHNIIAASAAGAGVATRLAARQLGGTVLVIGTPDEEKRAGKALMMKSDAFAGVDAALMIHAGGHDAATTKALACHTLEVEFFGKEAHAAASPASGINALEAMLLSFAAINSLRQHIKDKARIHGIITDGGRAANIVPGHSAGSFYVRAEDDSYLKELQQKVISCFSGAATASGARLEYKWAEASYAAMKNNPTLSRLFQHNMAIVGRKIPLADPAESFFSTDMGNVSQVVPAIHGMVAIAPRGTALHTPEFARAAVSARGNKGLIDATKALAMTVADVLAQPGLIAQAKEEFSQQK